MNNYDISLGSIEVTVAEHRYRINISHKDSGYMLYQFKRANPDSHYDDDEVNPILKPENVSVSRHLFELLDNKYGLVKESFTIGDAELTCECDKPMLQFDRLWSDGPSKHHWYKCLNCDTAGAAHSNHKDELTSAGPWNVK